MITGSLCLSEINELAKAGHSSFTRAANGKIYFNVLIWENDEPDKFGNNFSVQLNAKKDAPDTEKKKYIGNMKYLGTGGALPIGDVAKELPDLDPLPF